MHGFPLTLQRDREELLRARETVWRAWFAGDTKTLEKLVPPETIVMSGGEKENGKIRPMYCDPLLHFTPKGAGWFGLSFLAPKYGTLAMEPSFGAAMSSQPRLTASENWAQAE
jgi:hypothetical protein